MICGSLFRIRSSGSAFKTSRGFQPAAPRHEDAVGHVDAEMLGLVRVGGDGELRAEAFGGADHGARQIQPLGAAIDFQIHVAARGFGGHAFEIEGERIAIQQNAAGGMAHHAQ